MMWRRHFVLALPWTASALAQQPAPPAVEVPPLSPIRLAPGIAALPGGAWRITFTTTQELPDAAQREALERLGAALQAGSLGRITLNSEASAGEDVSTHRRMSLARARAVKEALVAGGLDETRVDIRALGRTNNPRDMVDVLSPTAPRTPG
jgi:hypothetical protein